MMSEGSEILSPQHVSHRTFYAGESDLRKKVLARETPSITKWDTVICREE